jgi:hypothetical protein
MGLSAHFGDRHAGRWGGECGATGDDPTRVIWAGGYRKSGEQPNGRGVMSFSKIRLYRTRSEPAGLPWSPGGLNLIAAMADATLSE